MRRTVSTMTPRHPRWQEFVDRLSGPEGCNFRERTPGDPKSITWECASGTDKSIAMKILAAMGFGQEAIARSCTFFESKGGYCDCEILFNVDRR